MGILVSRFKKKRTPLQVLEQIENKISSIENVRHNTELRQKKIVGQLILYSVAIYVIAAAIFYFYFFPASLRDRIFYIIPLLIFPIIVVILKRLVLWYYRHQLTSNEDKLFNLKVEKKQVLDTVMEKEVYKVAKEILEKFAPDYLRKITPTTVIPSTTVQPNKPVPSTPLIKKAITPSSLLLPQNSFPKVSPDLGRNTINGGHLPQKFQLTRPILPKERTNVDKFVDYLVGDGPNNRYALICKNCTAHNGMALKEEFPFIAFRCCYCGFMNPARKVRPKGPRLLNPPSMNAPTSSVFLQPSSESSGSDDDKERTKENSNNNQNLQTDEGNNQAIFRPLDEEAHGNEKNDDSPEKSDAEKKED